MGHHKNIMAKKTQEKKKNRSNVAAAVLLLLLQLVEFFKRIAAQCVEWREGNRQTGLPQQLQQRQRLCLPCACIGLSL